MANYQMSFTEQEYERLKELVLEADVTEEEEADGALPSLQAKFSEDDRVTLDE